MEKIVDLKKTVYELYQQDPTIIEIMKELGFNEVTKPGMLNTAGRFMTIPKGAEMRGIEMDTIKAVFKEKGYGIME